MTSRKKSTKHKISILLSLFGGLFGFGVVFVLAGVYDTIIYYIPRLLAMPYYVGGVSLFTVLGALIEFKRLKVGNLICLISGNLLVIYIIINQGYIIDYLQFLLFYWYEISWVLGIWVLMIEIGAILGFIEWLRDS